MKNLGKLLFVLVALLSALRWPMVMRASGATYACQQQAFGTCVGQCDAQDTPCFYQCQMMQQGYSPQPDGYYVIGSYSSCPDTNLKSPYNQCESPINSVQPYYGSTAGQCYNSCAANITACHNSCAGTYCIVM